MRFQPNNTVVCNLSALFVHGVSNFEPSILELKVKRTSLAAVKKVIREKFNMDDYSLVTQINEFYKLGITEYKGYRIYSLDRLIIELDNIKMEPGVRISVEREILKNINFEKFRRLYLEFQKLKKFKISRLATKLYKQNVETGSTLLAKLLNTKNRKSDVLREYILNNFVNQQKNDCIIKGGSAIQILLPGTDRATNDIDMNSHELNLIDIKESFTKGSVIWFKIYMLNSSGNIFNIDEDEIMEKIQFKMENKKVIKLRLVPITRNKDVKKELGNITMDLSINFYFDSKEMKEIEKEFGIRKNELNIYRGQSVKLFTREMIIGDKLHHIIKRKEESTRVKDLIDIVRIYENRKKKIDTNNIIKWIMLITKMNHENVCQELKMIQSYSLKKYRNHFSEALSMYRIKDKRDYNQYFAILSDFISTIIKQ